MPRTSKSKNEDWYKWEEEVANALGVKPVPGSGNQDWQKGDVVNSDWFFDCKQTDKESYSVKKSLFDKYKSLAALEDREFGLALNIAGEKLAVIPFETFLELQEKAARYDDLD